MPRTPAHWGCADERVGIAYERAANSLHSLSPFGERVGVRGLRAVLMDPNPLTHSLMLQKRVALSPAGRGHRRQAFVRSHDAVKLAARRDPRRSLIARKRERNVRPASSHIESKTGQTNA